LVLKQISKAAISLPLIVLLLILCTLSCSGEDWAEGAGDYGYIDRDGNVVIEPRFNGAYEFSEGLAEVSIGSIRGYINKVGEVVIEPRFESTLPFSEGLACVMEEEVHQYGYVDHNGDYVIEPKYPRAFSFSESLARIWTTNTAEGNTGFIDRTGEYVIPPEMGASESNARNGDFHEGLACTGWRRFVDVTGITVIDISLIDDSLIQSRRFSEGLAAVNKVDGIWGYIDTSGTMVIEPQYDDARIFSEGLAPVEIDGRWGYIDIHGNMVIDLQFEDAGIFSEGLAAVMVGEKWGYIDKNGNMVIEPQYEDAGYFSEGLAPVEF
jgi:hypothetical protein